MESNLALSCQVGVEMNFIKSYNSLLSVKLQKKHRKLTAILLPNKMKEKGTPDISYFTTLSVACSSHFPLSIQYSSN